LNRKDLSLDLQSNGLSGQSLIRTVCGYEFQRDDAESTRLLTYLLTKAPHGPEYV